MRRVGGLRLGEIQIAREVMRIQKEKSKIYKSQDASSRERERESRRFPTPNLPLYARVMRE